MNERDTKRIRYLLGLCSQAERERIEAEYFEDGAAFQAMLTAEDDLIDAYARGELTDEERRRFETHFLTSTRGRERVQFARAFAGVELKASVVGTKRPTTWLNISESLRGWPLRIATAAAVIVVVVALSWIFVERRRMSELREEHAEVSKQPESLPRSRDTGQTRNSEATTQPAEPQASETPKRRKRATNSQRRRPLPIQTDANRERTEGDVAGVAGRMLAADNRSRKDQAGVTLTGVEAIKTENAMLGNNFERKIITELPRDARTVVGLLTLQPDISVKTSTFSLGPRTTQSDNRTTITLASALKSITLKLHLDVARPHRDYRAVIETADGRPVTTLSWNTFELSNIVETSSLPTAYLSSGDYVLLLTGKISNGSFIRVAEFSFRVVKN